MAKAIPGEVFIPAKRVNFARCPHVGDLAEAVESSYGASECADFEFPENKINIDKFPKRFMGRTNGIYPLNFAVMSVYIKVYFNILSKFIELKKFFRPRSSPHWLREAHRVVGGRVERGGVAQIERRRQPHARGRRSDARRPVPGAEVEALQRPLGR